jgi:hypothetical protein
MNNINRLSPSEIENLSDIPFARTDSGVFVRAERLCFSLDIDIPGNYTMKVPQHLKDFKTLLSKLGAEDGYESNYIQLPQVTKVDISPVVLKGLRNSLDNTKTFADVDFVVEGKVIKAHRIILVMYSEKFRSQFQGEFLESKEGRITVQIEDVTYDGFKLFLQICYGNQTTLDGTYDLQALIDLLQLAHERI